jgi:integrase
VKGGIPKFCIRCRVNAVAWTNPRVDFCYTCLPGGPFPPPACQRCGGTENYYSQGLCRACHPRAPQHPGSCRDCYAWGVTREAKGSCWGCRNWRIKFPLGTCAICGRTVPVRDSACRLCWRQAASLRWTKTGLTLAEANRHGQQLFLANLHQRGKRAPRKGPQAASAHPAAVAGPRLLPRPVGYRQLVLLELPRDLVVGQRHGFPPPPDPDNAEILIAELDDFARQHGWGAHTIKRARRGIEILLALQDTPGAPIPTTLIYQLPAIDLPARLLHQFLDRFGLVDDDRTPAVRRWLDNQLAGLPEPMTTELRRWAIILWDGHITAPRSRARAQNTVQIKLRWALPTLRAWAAQGVSSLREISRSEVEAALPGSGNNRFTVASGLRAIFKVLKAHKIVFVDPTAKVRLGQPERRQPMPANLTVLRDGLDAPDPTRAVMTALLAFHGLRPSQLRALLLTDIRDGRLHLDKVGSQREIPLAEPVRVRLAAYLDYRNTRWPNTANPHLFVHYRTALGTQPVGGRWPGLVLGLPARDIRTDRILDEVHATGGDVRRVCDLFGLSIKAALRYTAVLDPPDLDPDSPDRSRHAP